MFLICKNTLLSHAGRIQDLSPQPSPSGSVQAQESYEVLATGEHRKVTITSNSMTVTTIREPRRYQEKASRHGQGNQNENDQDIDIQTDQHHGDKDKQQIIVQIKMMIFVILMIQMMMMTKHQGG